MVSPGASLQAKHKRKVVPVEATGTRILTTPAREMHRRQVRYGLETMCIGGGQGLAAVFERVEG
jgi:acetyl-CoA C-acetyltransferase